MCSCACVSASHQYLCVCVCVTASHSTRVCVSLPLTSTCVFHPSKVMIKGKFQFFFLEENSVPLHLLILRLEKVKNLSSTSLARRLWPSCLDFCPNRSSLNLSNGETESVKTMIVHDDVESEPAVTPSKEGTLIVRQVPASSPCQRPNFSLVINPLAHSLTHAVSTSSPVFTLTRPRAGMGRGRQV